MSRDRTSYYWSSLLIAVLLLLLFVTVLGSWAASVVGWQVENLLSEEGIRWTFRWWASPVLHNHTILMLSLLVAVGALQGCGLHTVRHHPWSLLASLVALAIMSVPLYILTMRAEAPLQSVTGQMSSSPFLQGIVFALGLMVAVAAMLYGLLSGYLRTWSACAALLHNGLRRYAPWIVVWLLAEHLCYLLTFVFAHS